jgi:phenylacetate-CoA ligase
VQSPETICLRLEELDPDIIEGYPSAISQVAPLAEGRFGGKKLRYISCGGETLTRVKRRAIERGFGVPVYDVFGAHECNIVAWECPQTGLYHVCDDNVVVEVVRDGRQVEQGEQGELVITALHSYTMPFIRYRMGNVVVKGPETCPCGQPFSTLHKIVGRVREYFILPNGRRIHPLRVVLPVFTENAPWLNQFQLTQETKTRFVLRLTAFRKPAAQELESIRKKFFNRLGPGVEFRVELVDHIPFEPSGKFKDCRNLINPDDE